MAYTRDLGLRLKYTAGKYLPFLRITPPPDRQVVFRLRPVRNGAIDWETNEDGEALLTVPRRKDRVGKVVGFWFRIPQTKAVQLDEVGTFVWNLCDGENTVEGIVTKAVRHYRMHRREAEVSVVTFIQMLVERGFVGLYQRGGKPK